MQAQILAESFWTTTHIIRVFVREVLFPPLMGCPGFPDTRIILAIVVSPFFMRARLILYQHWAPFIFILLSGAQTNIGIILTRVPENIMTGFYQYWFLTSLNSCIQRNIELSEIHSSNIRNIRKRSFHFILFSDESIIVGLVYSWCSFHLAHNNTLL